MHLLRPSMSGSLVSATTVGLLRLRVRAGLLIEKVGGRLRLFSQVGICVLGKSDRDYPGTLCTFAVNRSVWLKSEVRAYGSAAELRFWPQGMG